LHVRCVAGCYCLGVFSLIGRDGLCLHSLLRFNPCFSEPSCFAGTGVRQFFNSVIFVIYNI
jgi:hypothetical protein